MIESSNPEIDVQQLMERVRREVARAPQPAAPHTRAPVQRRSTPAEQPVKLPSLPDLPAMPPFQSSGPVDAKNERIDQILKQAREMTEAPSGVPKFFRSFFRKQGGFNRALLETVGSLAKTDAQLNKRVQELNSAAQHQTHWLQLLIEHRRADLNWMQTAAPVIASAAGSEQRLEERVEQLLEERAQLVEERANQLGARMSEHDSATEELRSGLAEIRVATVRTEAGLGGVQPLLQSQTDQLRALRSDVTRSSEHLRNLQGQVDATGEHLRNLQGTADRLLAISEQNERAAEHLRNLQTQVDRETEYLASVRERLERDAEHLRNLQAQSDRSGEHLRHLQDEAERAADQLKDFERIRITLARVEAEMTHLTDVRSMLSRLEERQANDAVYLKGQISQHASLLLNAISAPKGKKRAASPAVSGGDLTHATADGALDPFYLSFENRFRGTRAQIKDRVRFYLPILKRAKVGTAARPVLDVGCGRGEWLELLEENRMRGSGIDLNRAMIAECEERNLKVTHADVIEHLRSLKDDTLGCVSGFHIIEHLPFEVLIELASQTRRVLKPGGLAIFESPNCKNLMVGACYFNVDPTHRNPVFPETAGFILETQGFEEVRLEYLSPAERPFTGADHDAEMLNDLLFGPQDFAVIGRKPAAR
ncbi:MAG: methyltransferase domain-containing protein [Chthoniobacterales bacterium]|nr:methyltransferase domain-containing protein [Chthoniobacterales bacterium]